MADGMTAATEAATLYERDFHAWTVAQAAALRATGSAQALDYGNLAEEIESLGRRDRQEVEAEVATIIEHLVKLEFSPAPGPRPGWRATVREARRAIARSIRASPSLRRAAVDAVTDEAAGAVGSALAAMADHGETIGVAQAALAPRPHTVEQVLGDWWPEGPTPPA